MPRQRRTSLEIVVAVLKGIRQQSRSQVGSDNTVSVHKRQLMRSANLNHNQLTNYLDTLENKQFIILEETGSGLTAEITSTGEQFLNRADTLSTFLDEDFSE